MEYFFNHGMALVFQEKYEESIKYFDLALKADSTHSSIHSFKAIAQKSLGLYDDTLVSDNRAIICCKKPRELPSLHYHKGDTLFDAGRPQEGLECIKGAFEIMNELNHIDCAVASLAVGKGLNLLDEGRYGEALEIFDIVLGLGTWDVEIDWPLEDVIEAREEAKLRNWTKIE